MVLDAGAVASRFRTADGWTVEVVFLAATPDHHDGAWLRVRHHGFHVLDTRRVADLERYFPLTALEEV